MKSSKTSFLRNRISGWNVRPRKKLGYKTPYEVFFYIYNRVVLDIGMCVFQSLRMLIFALEQSEHIGF